MSTPEEIRKRLDSVGKELANAERQLASERSAHAKKSSKAASLRTSAAKSSSPSTAKSRLRQAESAEKDALAANHKIAGLEKRVAKAAKKQATLNADLTSALKRQAKDEERTRKRQAEQERRARERERQADRRRTDAKLSASERRLGRAIAEIRPPKPERLRILYLTAAPESDLRVDKEIRRVKRGVQAATHRDLVQIDHMPAATASDLLDGLARFRPHVVHFSGHADWDAVVFDTDADDNNPGQEVSAGALAQALAAVDEPPTLVVLNACESVGHLRQLLAVVPLAVGMADEVGDVDAMSFAARFYTSIAEGQSVRSAVEAARVQMALDGMPDADLPELEARPGVDPSEVRLVIVPPAL